MGQLAHMKAKNSNPAPVSDLLKRTIAEAIAQVRTNLLALERETGVSRASIRRFLNGERTIRLDVADKLADYFGLVLKKR
jgi:plasmid maintenance system antidote protein VapI